MAERKTGPVKPPTIELTARETGAESAPRAAAAKPVDPAEEMVTAADADGVPPPQPIPPVPPSPEPPRLERPAVVAVGATPPWGMLATAAIAGALLGTALTYVLATMVPLPAPAVPNLAPQIREQSDRLSTVEERLTATETGTLDAKSSIDATTGDLVARLTALEGGLDELRAKVPAPVDTTAIEGRLRTLTSRVDAIAAGASSADAGAMAENIDDLEAAVAALQTEVGALKTQTADTSALSALEADVAALKAQAEAAAAEPEPPPVAALEQTMRGLETAFETGAPYATELASLADQQPPIAIDPGVAARAGHGLQRPDVLDQFFADAVPQMLEAKPVAAGDWQQTAGQWLSSLFAIRPSDAVEGDSPEAVMSRLEAAMSRHDYGEATTLFAALPPEMVAPAKYVADETVLLAAAQTLLAEIRARVSAP